MSRPAVKTRQAFEAMATAKFDVLDSCVAHRVEKVIVASAASIYGPAPEFPTTECAVPYNDRTLYGGLKLLGESLLRAVHDTHDLSYCAPRYLKVIGPPLGRHSRYTELRVRWLERLDQGLPPLIFGNGRQTTECIDVRDIASTNIATARAASTVAFNITSGRDFSLLALACALVKVTGRSGIVPLPEQQLAVNPAGGRPADVAKARAMFKFSATIGLHNTLHNLLTWQRDDRQPGEVGRQPRRRTVPDQLVRINHAIQRGHLSRNPCECRGATQSQHPLIGRPHLSGISGPQRRGSLRVLRCRVVGQGIDHGRI